MNQFNAIHIDEPTDPTIECNNQPLSVHFKSRTSTPKTIPVVFSIIGRINHHDIDNGDVNVHPPEYPLKSNTESVTDLDTTPIKSIDDDEMYQLLELFHSEYHD